MVQMFLHLPSSNVAWVDGIGQNTLVIFRPNESWVAILFEQQNVDVTGGNFKGEP